MQAVIDLSRKDLNDNAKKRYADNDLLLFLNNYVQTMIQQRPDLFIGKFSSLPGTLALTDNYPFPATFDRAGADYVIGRAHMINTEASSIERAGLYLSLTSKESGR
jgi:hypothetical protein